MAVKTITIDMEAYETLVRARRGNESFGTVMKQTLGPAGKTASGLLRRLDDYVVDETVLDNIDRVIASRAYPRCPSLLADTRPGCPRVLNRAPIA